MGVFKKDGMWWIDYYHKGRRFREKVGPDKRQAERALGKRRSQIADDKFFEARIRHKRFKDFAEYLIDWYEQNRPRSSRNVPNYMNNFIAFFGNRNMDEITKADVEKYIEQRKEDLLNQRTVRGKVADGSHFATVNREIAYLKRLFKWAIEKNHARQNPCDGIKRQNERERTRFLREEENEEARLLEACSDRIGDIVRFALNTGLRRNEIATLTWDCVDMNREYITVLPDNAKNGEQRTIGFNDVTKEILLQLKRDRKRPSGHVFLNRAGKPYQPGAISNQFMKAVEKAELPDFRFHDLRHTFASRLAMRGVPLLDIARLMGHKTLQMVMRYSHFTDQHLKAHVELLTQPARTPKMQHMDTIWTPGAFSVPGEAPKTNGKPWN